MSENYFVELNNINVNGKTEKKNGLTYLSGLSHGARSKSCTPTRRTRSMRTRTASSTTPTGERAG